MEGNARRWFIKKEHYLNADTYNVCMKSENDRLPAMCIGAFQGLEELGKFRDMLKNQLCESLAADAHDAYTQIIAAIEETEDEEHGRCKNAGHGEANGSAGGEDRRVGRTLGNAWGG